MEYKRTLLVVDQGPEPLKSFRSVLSQKYDLLWVENVEKSRQILQKRREQGQPTGVGLFGLPIEDLDSTIKQIQSIKKSNRDLYTLLVAEDWQKATLQVRSVLGPSFENRWDFLWSRGDVEEVLHKVQHLFAAWDHDLQSATQIDKLLRAERLSAISQVARGAAHDLGNALFRIMGKIDLALLEDDAQTVKEHLQKALLASERAGFLIRNLQSSYGLTMEFQKSRISDVVNRSLSLVELDLEKEGVKAHTRFESDPEIYLDSRKMEQVFLNLFMNSTQAMPDDHKGEIWVTVRDAKCPRTSSKDGISVEIVDSGKGISPQLVDHVFDFVFSTDPTRRGGLGLSVVQNIVKDHGGIVRVQSPVTRGARFEVWLPLTQEEK